MHRTIQGVGCDSDAAVSVSICIAIRTQIWKLKCNLLYLIRHDFHKSCIDPWLLEHRTCPMCKMDILKHYGFVVGVPNSPNTSTSTTTTASATASSATPPPVVVVVNVMANINEDTTSLNAQNTSTRIDPSSHVPNTSSTTVVSSPVASLPVTSSSSSGSSSSGSSRSRTESFDNSSIIDRESVHTSGHVLDVVTDRSSEGADQSSSYPQPMIPTESRQVTDV